MSELEYTSESPDPIDDDEDAPHAMYCLFCTCQPTHPDFYPYCSQECALNAELEG